MAHKVNRINTKITEEERELKDNDVRFWNTSIIKVCLPVSGSLDLFCGTKKYFRSSSVLTQEPLCNRSRQSCEQTGMEKGGVKGAKQTHLCNKKDKTLQLFCSLLNHWVKHTFVNNSHPFCWPQGWGGTAPGRPAAPAPSVAHRGPDSLWLCHWKGRGPEE